MVQVETMPLAIISFAFQCSPCSPWFDLDGAAEGGCELD
jgi:hypothetical protein